MAFTGSYLYYGNIYFGNLLKTTNYCSEEDYQTARSADNYYDPEEVYKVGLNFQKILKNKDIEQLYSFVNESSSVPRKKKVIEKGFDAAFSKEFVNDIIQDTPPCSPYGWRGFYLGRDKGSINYGHDGTIISIGYANFLEDYPEEKVWKLNNTVISSICLKTIWSSGDNYEVYEEKFKIKDTDDFRNNPGKYFISKVPVDALDSPWDEGKKLSIIGDVPDCNSVKQNIKLGDRGVTAEVKSDTENSIYSYNLLKKIPLSLCKELTPNIEQNCKSSFLASVFYNGGGSASWDYYYIYGLFNIDGVNKIIPLKRFKSARLARNFVEGWEEENR